MSNNIEKQIYFGSKDEVKVNELKSKFNIYDGTHMTPKYVDQGIPFFSVESINTEYEDVKKFIEKDVYEKEIKRVQIEQNDILMTRIGDVGTTRIVNFEDSASFYVSLALLKPLFPNSIYYKYLLDSEDSQRNIWKNTIHVAFPKKINLIDLNSVKIKSHENNSTQQKIGNTLSQIDNLISNNESKKCNLVQLKNILFYELITRNLHNTNWNCERLEKLSQINTGNKDVKDATPSGKYNFYIRSKEVLKIDEYAYNGEAILIGGDGKINELIHYYNGPFNYHQRVYKISNFNNINGLYLYYFIHKFVGKQLLKDSAKTTVDSVRLPTLQKFNILYPDTEHQKKIAYTLSQMDKLIEIEEKKLEQLEKMKKYHLQQFFN